MKQITWAGHAACMVKKKNACRILVSKPEGKRPVGRPTLKWEDNIRTDVEEGCKDLDWFLMVQNGGQWRIFVKTEINLRVP